MPEYLALGYSFLADTETGHEVRRHNYQLSPVVENVSDEMIADAQEVAREALSRGMVPSDWHNSHPSTLEIDDHIHIRKRAKVGIGRASIKFWRESEKIRIDLSTVQNT